MFEFLGKLLGSVFSDPTEQTLSVILILLAVGIWWIHRQVLDEEEKDLRSLIELHRTFYSPALQLLRLRNRMTPDEFKESFRSLIVEQSALISTDAAEQTGELRKEIVCWASGEDREPALLVLFEEAELRVSTSIATTPEPGSRITRLARWLVLTMMNLGGILAMFMLIFGAIGLLGSLATYQIPAWILFAGAIVLAILVGSVWGLFERYKQDRRKKEIEARIKEATKSRNSARGRK